MKCAFSELAAQTLLDTLAEIAEPAFKEFRTTEFIVDFLHNNNIPVDKILKTGCFGTIDCGAGKTIALRADIDALPANPEATAFKHLCGHHAHTAALLLALQFINQHRNQLKVNIRYIFQPAEEIARGATFMLEHNCLDGCAEVYGIHVDPDQRLGGILLKPGELMAGAKMFEICFRGQSTHAAYPHTGDDVLVAATDYINLCQKIITRFKNPVKKAVLSFGQIHGGQACNILADELVLKGTYRYFDDEICSLIEEKMIAIAQAIELIYGISVDVSYIEGTVPLINQPDLVAKLNTIFFATDFTVISDHDPAMGGEDFPYFFTACPGVFVNLGIAGSAGHPPLHNKDFTVPVEAVQRGAEFWTILATHLD